MIICDGNRPLSSPSAKARIGLDRAPLTGLFSEVGMRCRVRAFTNTREPQAQASPRPLSANESPGRAFAWPGPEPPRTDGALVPYRDAPRYPDERVPLFENRNYRGSAVTRPGLTA